MRFLTILFLVSAVSLSALIYSYFETQRADEIASGIERKEDAIEDMLETIKKEEVLPSPMRGSSSKQAGELTVKGILSETNEYRGKGDLEKVAMNKKLSEAARNKAKDIFAKQYFEHVSPDGTRPADLVSGVGYDFIKIGENLALGNFKNDADVVRQWMESKGHRENIMSEGFTEIGIAAVRGEYEGEQTWVAVQTFALPVDACPRPKDSLKGEIRTKKGELDSVAVDLKSIKEEIGSRSEKAEELSKVIKKQVEAGNSKIEAGNKLIEEGNRLLGEGDLGEAQKLQAEGKRLQEEGADLIEEAKGKQEKLNSLAKEIQSMREDYNERVDDYNEVNDEIKGLTKKHNNKVREFNACAGDFGTRK